MQYFCAVCGEPVSNDKQELEPGAMVICAKCQPSVILPNQFMLDLASNVDKAQFDAKMADEFEQSFLMLA